MVPNNLKYTPILSLLAVSFLWGSTFPGSKYVLATLPLYFYMAIRFVLAAAVLLPLCWKELKATSRRDRLISGLIGLILFASLSLQTVALLYTSAAKNSFAFSAYVVLVPVLGFLVFKNRLNRQTLLAGVLAIVGLGFISGEDGLKGGWDKGVMITLVSALFMAMQIVALGRCAQRVPPLVLTFFQTLVVAVLCLITSLAVDGWPDFQAVTAPTWLCIGFMAVFSTALSYALQCSAQRHVEQSVAAIILSMCCVFGALQSWLFLGEPLTLKMLIGGAVLVCSILLAQLPERSLRAAVNRVKSKFRA